MQAWLLRTARLHRPCAARAHRAPASMVLAKQIGAGIRAAPSSISSRRPSLRTSMATSAAKVDVARARGAVEGALVADAATMGLHWIYDQGKIAELLKAKTKTATPEFYEPPSCPFYQLPSGSLSPYGAELHALLAHLSQPAQAAAVAAKGPLDGSAWAAALASYFGSPSYAGYKNKSIKSLIAAVTAGKQYPETGDAQDTQANSMCKVPLIVALYAGQPTLPAAVEVAVRAQQNNATSVTLGLAAARILEQVVLGASLDEALAWAQAEGNLPSDVAGLVKQALAAKGQPFNAAAQQFGLSCGMPGAFQVALLAASQASSYEAGVRANMQAGGDNASRSVFLGALLGAAHGVPSEWKAKVTGWEQMQAAVDKLLI